LNYNLCLVKRQRSIDWGANLKDFNDFLKSITQEDLNAIFEDANKKAAEARDAMSSGKEYFGNQIGVVSYTIALELLGLYHKWLEQ